MKRLTFAASLLFFGAGAVSGSEWTLPWLHTRPKPVILAAEAKPPAEPARVTYHGKTSYTAAGRLYFPVVSREQPAVAKHSATKARIWKAIR